MENFVPRIKALLTERNHGVLLTGISLMIELCELDPSVIKTFRKVSKHENKFKNQLF